MNETDPVPSDAEIVRLVAHQVATNFMLSKSERKQLCIAVPAAKEKTLNCFKHYDSKYYWRNESVAFNLFHSAQYCIFLYFLSKAVYSAFPGSRTLADKLYYLNRLLNCVDMYYEVDLPPVFFLDHPLGSVMGRATYANYFSFAQSCTVGNNRGVYPVFKENVKLCAGASVLGQCTVGPNVIIAAHTHIIDVDIEPNSIVFGRSPDLVIKQRPPEYFGRWAIGN